jgi:hypothetical protein
LEGSPLAFYEEYVFAAQSEIGTYFPGDEEPKTFLGSCHHLCFQKLKFKKVETKE